MTAIVTCEVVPDRWAAGSQSLAVSAAAADAMGVPVQIGFTPGRTYNLSFTAQF